MRLFNVKGHTEQNAHQRWLPGQPYVSWKGDENNKTVVVSKSVKNDMPDNVNQCTNNCGFIPNPIKHYRKQYVSTNSNNTGYSRSSLIGSLDKPNSFSITSTTCLDGSLTQLGNEYILDFNTQTCGENGKCLVIKSATTVIGDNYSQSSREYLWKKCRTFDQNLPSGQSNLTNPNCSETNNCNSVFMPSNTKFQTQGPVSSSTRIASLKYNCNDPRYRRCFIRSTDYNTFGKTNDFDNTTELPAEICCHTGIKKRRSNIRIMQ